MILYHIEKLKYKDIWPPEGTLYAEGRWNHMRQWVLYTSTSIALAKLEILANVSTLPLRRVCMTIEVSGNSEILEIEHEDLPVDWMRKPYPANLVSFTKFFLNSGCLLMKVPSAQSISEFNYLINVRHKQFHEQVKLVHVSAEPFDPRLKN
ncbi:MAG: RES domain-containing protein [Cyclobacteriaceae bacterium]|jgi:RES domain-containing protein